MNSWMPSAPLNEMYDLKGAADDKMLYKVHVNDFFCFGQGIMSRTDLLEFVHAVPAVASHRQDLLICRIVLRCHRRTSASTCCTG